MLRVALSAPSGDNCQPWSIRINARGFDVLFEAERARALLDVAGLASQLALGALLETARLEAERLGLAMEVQLEPRHGIWARCSLSRAQARLDELHAAITRRYSNRQVYDGSMLLQQEARALLGEVVGSSQLVLTTKRSELVQLASLGGEAERIRARSRLCHEDLQRWLRWSHGRSVETRDGLDVRTLGLSVAEQRALRAIGPWSVAKWVVAATSQVNGQYARRLMESSSGVGLLCVPSLAPHAVVEAGRSMQRVWLRATQLGLAFSPMAALPLLVLSEQQRGAVDLGEASASRLRALGGELKRLVPSMQGLPVFMFRVGRAPGMVVRALRRRLEDVVLPEGGSDAVE